MKHHRNDLSKEQFVEVLNIFKQLRDEINILVHTSETNNQERQNKVEERLQKIEMAINSLQIKNSLTTILIGSVTSILTAVGYNIWRH